MRFRREDSIAALEDRGQIWDFIILGGGATGLGVAVDAASRGYQTLLLERSDFAKGTSSRSTKLVHGGVRYLEQGNLSLVMEALKERGLLRRNAPHLVRDLPFVVPNYDWWEAPFYGIGLRFYDLLAGKYGFGPSRNLSKEKTLELIPTIETEGLRGGVIYHDGQFDDARLAINLAQTAAEQGAVLLNYCQATGLSKTEGFLTGVRARDLETGRDYDLRGNAVINATGVFTDQVLRLDDPEHPGVITPSQGVHLVLPRDFLPGASAIMVPHTDDGRVLFAIPWHDRVVVGTTDTPVGETLEEPVAFEHEVEFILTHAARYLSKDPQPSDVLSVFAGLRPLVKAVGEKNTASLSRDHTVIISPSGLLTITGGKWTTYRHMAEDAVDQAAILAQVEERDCRTRELPIHGHTDEELTGPWAFYGSDREGVLRLAREEAGLAEPVLPGAETLTAQVVWAAREEMARTVEDFLSRRTRELLLDAEGSIQMAPRVASILARELGKDSTWEQEQVESFQNLARGYRLGSL
jgi:glycerol-3-phosphate dehydrogenase